MDGHLVIGFSNRIVCETFWVDLPIRYVGTADKRNVYVHAHEFIKLSKSVTRLIRSKGFGEQTISVRRFLSTEILPDQS